jgi:hypothetical protein
VALHALRNRPHLLADHIEFLAEDISSLLNRDENWFAERYAKVLRPLVATAALQGFSTDWVCQLP